jgi:hypothetical protein
MLTLVRVTFMVLLCLPQIAFANPKDKEEAINAEATKSTQELLTNKKAREEAIKSDSSAKSVDQHVEALGGTSENKEEMYAIAAQYMADLVQKTNGDPVKMQEMLAQFQKDPASFFAQLKPEQKKQIENLARSISSKNAPTVPKK